LLVSDSPSPSSSASPDQGNIRVVSESRLKSSVRIMMIGCGHSSLSVDLFNEGYTNMVSVDSSQEVITYMAERHPQMIWLVGDARDLKTTLPAEYGESGS